MNKIKTIKYLLVLLALPIISNVVYYTSDGEAWLNGKYCAYYVQKYKADFEAGHTQGVAAYYGTHDWIAECAVELLYEFYPDNLFIQMLKFNTYDLKVWYLFGTEVPDTLHRTGPSGYKEVNTGLHKFSQNKNDFPYYTIQHQERFAVEPEGEQVNTNLEEQAQGAKDRAILMFAEKDCKGAAFYLGVMAHYIGDASYCHHTTELTAQYHPQHTGVRAKVQYLTRRKYSAWPVDNGGPFFNIDLARAEFGLHSPILESARNAIYLTGFDTFYGHAFLQSQDAAFRSNSHKTANWMVSRFFPEDVFGDKELGDWRFNDWSALGSGDDRDFLETINHALNVAVYYLAGVLNHMKNYYTECLFIGEQVQEQLNELLIQYPLYVLLAVAGPIATMFTVAQTLSEKMLFYLYKNAKLLAA